MRSQVTVSLLGPPRVERGGRAIEFDTRKAIALLAYVILEGQPQSRDRLATMFWPDADQDRARASLRRTLSPVRSALGDGVLRTDTLRVEIVPGALAVDVERFRELVRSGKLEGAVSMYRGDFLAGFSLKDSPEFEDWQSARQSELRDELRGALARLASDATSVASRGRAVAYAKRMIDLDPLDEIAHQTLMRLHAAAGDRAAAMRQYSDLVRVLDAELGVAPMSETKDLYERIRLGESGAIEQMRRSAEEAAADVYTLHGSYPKAIASYEAAIGEASADARPEIEHKLAEVHHRRGDWERAESHYRRASAGGDDAHKARVFADWSLAAHRRGDPSRALTLARKALALSGHSGELRALAQTHNILGILTRDEQHLERALELSRGLPEPSVRIAVLNNLALAHLRTGRLDRALTYARDALDQSESLGDRHRQAALHNNLADVLQALGKHDEAMRHLKRSATLFSEIGGAREPEVWKLVEW